jgi:hypothetical protein
MLNELILSVALLFGCVPDVPRQRRRQGGREEVQGGSSKLQVRQTRTISPSAVCVCVCACVGACVRARVRWLVPVVQDSQGIRSFVEQLLNRLTQFLHMVRSQSHVLAVSPALTFQLALTQVCVRACVRACAYVCVCDRLRGVQGYQW